MEGQSVIDFREELLSLIEEADGVSIGVNNLICMMLQIGVSDFFFQKELGAIQTLPCRFLMKNCKAMRKLVKLLLQE